MIIINDLFKNLLVYLVNIKVKSNKFVKEIFGIYMCINEMIE